MNHETNRTWTLLLAALLVMVMAVPAGAQLLETDIEVELRAEVHRAHQLQPATPQAAGQVEVDAAESVRWLFGSASKTLQIVLTAPDGRTFSLADPDTVEARSLVFPDPTDPATTGANYLFVLDDPLPGTWSYAIQETVPLAGPRAVLLNFFSTSPVRSALLGGGEDYRVDRPVSLALVTAEGPDLLTNLAISATARGVDGTTFPEVAVSFADDGGGADANTGDGMFTASFQPGAPGSYRVLAEIVGQRSNGDDFQRTVTALVRVLPVRATLNGAFADRGIDLDGDGLLDQIGVAPSVQVLEAGEYNLSITLESGNGGSLTSNLLATLPAGVANPEVFFRSDDVKSQLAADGPYGVAVIRVEAADTAATVDAVFDAGSTAAYLLDDFQRRAILFTGGGAAQGVDVNGNGKYDFLDVTLDADFRFSGFYRWSARLVDGNGTEVALAGNGGFFASGERSLSLRFDGSAIGGNGVDGPYFVRNLVIFGAGESLIVDDPLTTQAFLAEEFEGFVADSTPPQITVTVSPEVLWPPNHELIEIAVDVQVSDDQDPNPQVTLEAVTSNEGDDMVGDGHTTGDIQLGPNGELYLRAERSGTGEGRVYTLTYAARDAAGNTAQTTAQVVVPRSQGGR